MSYGVRNVADMTSTCWYTDSLLGFDTETTGVDPETDRIISAALVTDESSSHWLINADVEIPPPATAVHGITQQQLATDGHPPAVALTQITAVLNSAIDARTPVVAYRAGFDFTLLSHELDRHGLPQLDWQQLRVIDPFVLDKRVDKYRRGKRTLTAVCEHYGVSLTRAHSATADAAAAIALARKIGHIHPQVATMNPAELHVAQRTWHADDAASLEAYLRRKGRDETCDRRWPLQREHSAAAVGSGEIDRTYVA